MKKLVAAATFVALGAGTAGVGALNNVEWRGSDTLFAITSSILSQCPAAGAGATLIYVGGGSTGGEDQMLQTSNFASPSACNLQVSGSTSRLDCQVYAPMSRFLAGGATSARTCRFPLAGTTRDASRSEGIAFALDALSVYVNQRHANTCNPGADDCDPLIDTANPGLGSNTGLAWDGKAIPILDLNGIPGVQCPPGSQSAACTAAGGAYSYTIETPNAAGDRATDTWRDVLRIIYAGLPVGEQSIANRDCNGDLRRTLVENWGNMFQNNCSGGTDCTALRHAFRRDDESGTTDVFAALLSLPSIALATDVTPFCNAAQTGDEWNGTQFCPVTAVNNRALITCTVDSDCWSSYPEATCSSGVCGIETESPGCFPGPRPAPRASDVAALKNWKPSFPIPAYFPDFQDNDPIRRACAGEYTRNQAAGATTPPPAGPAEEVCRARRARVTGSGGPSNVDKEGTLGLVLTINPPPTTVPKATAYPTKFCRQGSFAGKPAPRGAPNTLDPEMYIYPIAGDCNANPSVCPATAPPNTVFVGCRDRSKGVGTADFRCAYSPAVDRCPNGDVPLPRGASSGTCQIPHDGAGDFRCMNVANNLPVAKDGILTSSAVATLTDFDRTNRLQPVRSGQFLAADGLGSNGNADGRAYNLQVRDATGNLVSDQRGRQIIGAFYRIHSSRTLLAGADAGCPNGICCQEDSATQQLSCLTQASPCSMAFAGREGNTVQLVTGPTGGPTTVHNASQVKLNAMDGSLACVQALLDPAVRFYPFSRKLYLNTMEGFEHAESVTEERAMATCFSGTDAAACGGMAGCTGGITGGLAALQTSIAAVGFINLPTAPQCQDFRQQNALTSAANGCNQALAAGACDDACRNNPPGIVNDDPLVANVTGSGAACP